MQPPAKRAHQRPRTACDLSKVNAGHIRMLWAFVILLSVAVIGLTVLITWIHRY